MRPTSPTLPSLDRLLALLILVEVGTGALTLGAGSPHLGWVYVAHGLVSGALAWGVFLKLRASLPRAVAGRRVVRLVAALALTVLVVAALAGGFVWVAAGRLLSVGPWTLLTLHAWAGLALIPLVAVHLLPRRWRLLRSGPRAAREAGRRLISRRALLVATAFAGASVVLYAGTASLDLALGGARRFTGSRPLPPGGVPPTTTFLGDGVPVIDRATWLVRVHGRVQRETTYSLADLGALRQTRLEATLDCTSGWFMSTSWSGVALSTLLAASEPEPAATWVDVRSSSGWSTRLTMDDALPALLATAVADRPLPDGNGAPCRLVVPDRRGLDWVKWVTEIEVS